MSNCKIYLVRHGETDWNLNKRIQGHTDNMLNETGRKQAREVAESFKHIRFDAVHSSDLLRARETAEIIVSGRNLSLTIHPELRERYYATLEGMDYEKADDLTKHELNEFEQLSFEEKMNFKYYSGVETNSEVVSRFFPKLVSIAKSHPSQTVLIAAHAGIVALSLLHLKVYEYIKMHQFEMQNGCFIVLDFDGENFEVSEIVGIELVV